MKKFLVLAALALSGCSTVPGVDPITGNPIATEVTKIQAAAVKGCSFEPTFATVSDILATFIPGASPVTAIIDQVAKSICDAVTAKSFRLGQGAAMVNGIPVNGSFVARKRSGRYRSPMVNGVVIDGRFVGP